MKLRNKLIPLMSAATLAATVAPVTLTACGGTSMVNLINGYTPTIAKAKWEDYSANKDDMLAFYASSVHENPEILSQDIYWRDSTQMLFVKDIVKYMEDTTVTINTLESKISNVVIRQCPCQYEDETTGETIDVKYYTISLDYTMHYAYDSKGVVLYSPDDYDVPGTESVDSTITISCQNIPFTVNRKNTTREKVYSNARYLSWFYDLDVQTYEAMAFYYGFMPTDWLIQFQCFFELDAEENIVLNHEAFTNLENNGFDWYIKTNEKINATTSTAISDPVYNEYEFNSYLHRDSQFTDIIEAIEKDPSKYIDIIYTLDGHAILNLICWYLPTYYLSDIIDVNSQIWG